MTVVVFPITGIKPNIYSLAYTLTLRKILITGMLGAMCLASPFFTQAQVNSAFDRGSFINKTDTLPYRILFPKKFDPTQKYAR
jgi:hypothetical protein